MSVKIVQKPLPAGVVPYEEISDPTVKQKVMLLNRNIASLAAQLAEVQRAAIELQQRPMPKQKEIADIERYVAQAAASAESAATSATSAGQSAASAGGSETSAGNSAVAAGVSETNAANSEAEANTAKIAAESAREEAVPAAATAARKAQEALESAERAEAAAAIAQVEGYVVKDSFEVKFSVNGSEGVNVYSESIAKQGYEPIGVCEFDTTNSSCVISGMKITEYESQTVAYFRVRNVTSTSKTYTLGFSVLYIRNGINQQV